MKSIQDKSREHYAKLALERKNKTVVAGRYDFDEGKEQLIVDDIITKLDFKAGESVLDIGCGFGYVTEAMIDYLSSIHSEITLMDIDEVMDAVDRELLKKRPDNQKIHMVKGIFPDDFHFQSGEKFDRILLYSVLHYSNDPEMMIDQAMSLLKPYGKLLLGDLPNISKKGRFLSSSEGRKFEASYKKIAIGEVPFYKDASDFVAKMKADPNYYSLIDDEFIQSITSKYKNSGHDVYVIPQPQGLPFCNTREDLLICRYD